MRVLNFKESSPSGSTSDSVQVEPSGLIFRADTQFQFNWAIEPFPYTRLNHNSRWTAGPGSQEFQYMAWVDKIRELYDTLDYNSITGVPFHEPLSVRGDFFVSENCSGKDLDNLVKGIMDCMNPSRKKDFSGLRTFVWVDDRQIVSHGPYTKRPQKVLPNIAITVAPLWSRYKHNLNFAPRPLLGWPQSAQGWMWPHPESDQFRGFTKLEFLLWHRFCHVTQGISPQAFHELLATGEESTNEAIASGKTKLGAKVQRVVSVIKERLPDPIGWFEQTPFDQLTFESTARELSEELRVAWSSIRASLMHQFIDWSRPQTDDNLKAFAKRYEKR
jgi:hypothetical protein